MSNLIALLQDLPKEDLIDLFDAYDDYIQNANDEDLFHSGWRPVCLLEFYGVEFQLLKETHEEVAAPAAYPFDEPIVGTSDPYGD